MSLVLLFVLAALASYRLWRFVSLDDFPPMTKIRDSLEARVGERHGLDWAQGITCAWCAGWWASCIVVGLVWLARPLPVPALWFGAVSTAVGLLAMTVEE